MSHVTYCVISSFVADCKLLDSQILRARVAHCHKEANKCVDALAKMDLMHFETPPSRVIGVFNFDDVGRTLMDSALVPLMFPSFSWMNVVLPTKKIKIKICKIYSPFYLCRYAIPLSARCNMHWPIRRVIGRFPTIRIS